MSMTGTETPSGARDAALADLRRAVAALTPHIDTPDQRADLALIEDAVARLSMLRPTAPHSLGDFDPSRLSHLLQLTGPDLAHELLARLTEDLITTRETLDIGAATADWTRLREGSHVLISLAGSVGALSLQAMAERLNAISHRQEVEALSTLMPALTDELFALIALVRATPSPFGTSS
jgi:HPt (histidine-containing phosphotransfer) domain-containing protein